jgi:hypothetical protein
MYFTAFLDPSGEPQGGSASVPVAFVTPEGPRTVVSTFDFLCATRDDFKMTDWIGSVVTGALCTEGNWARALHVLTACPSLKDPTTVRDSAAQRRIIRILYHLHGVNSEAKCFTLLRFPFAFPRDVLCRLPPPQSLRPQFFDRREAEDEQKSIARIEQQANANASSLRPGRQHYFPQRLSTPQSAEVADKKIKDHFLFMSKNKHRMTFEKDPNGDPRPDPLGINGTASGWAFLHRGGLKIFSNSRKVPHLLSMRPKQMNALKNPHRGWNPRQNSSLAHMEVVKKWNPRSSL